MRQFVFNSRAASNMARLLSVAAIVLLLLGSDSLTAECRHLRLAGERGTGVALRRLLVGGLRSPPNCSLWGLGNCTTGAPKLSDIAATSAVTIGPAQWIADLPTWPVHSPARRCDFSRPNRLHGTADTEASDETAAAEGGEEASQEETAEEGAADAGEGEAAEAEADAEGEQPAAEEEPAAEEGSKSSGGAATKQSVSNTVGSKSAATADAAEEDGAASEEGEGGSAADGEEAKGSEAASEDDEKPKKKSAKAEAALDKSDKASGKASKLAKSEGKSSKGCVSSAAWCQCTRCPSPIPTRHVTVVCGSHPTAAGLTQQQTCRAAPA